MTDQRQPTSSAHDFPPFELWPEEWLARSLRVAREALEMSQEDVARAMAAYGFTWRQTTVQKTEAATRPIRVNEAVALAEVLRIDPTDLWGGARDDWEGHAHVLRLTNRTAILDERLSEIQQEMKKIKEERSELVEELERAREAYAEAQRRREAEARTAVPPLERLRLTKYGDVRLLVAPIRDGKVVAIDVQDMHEADAKRSIDFAAGMAAASDSVIVRLKRHNFLVAPRAVPGEAVMSVYGPDLVGSE